MKVMKPFGASVGLLPALCAATQISSPQMPMPPEIGIRLTIEGPVFVDTKGMTLYKKRSSGLPIESCNDRHHPVLLHSGGVDFTVAAPDSETRRTCVQKRPPLPAPANAKPVGKWSIHLREDGSRQWAHDGEPLYTSIKDKAPGEINGSFPPFGLLSYPWKVATAPLIGAPAQITARKTSVGLALASHAGKTLYYAERDEAAAGSDLWQPLLAPVLAKADKLPDWSIMTRIDGSPQWAYKGRALYTYVHDSGLDTAGSRILGDVFGGTYGRRVEGWHVALLKEAPKYPAEVTIQTLIEGDFRGHSGTSTKRIYANAEGMTLYTIHCVENTADKLDCDDVGDSSRYWVSFCGGEKRCANTWRPLAAPALAKSIDDTWSVIVINPDHPWRVREQGSQELRVWAYRGRPVFTYAQDLRPGDYNGAVPSDGHGHVIYARTVLAYETDDNSVGQVTSVRSVRLLKASR